MSHLYINLTKKMLRRMLYSYKHVILTKCFVNSCEVVNVSQFSNRDCLVLGRCVRHEYCRVHDCWIRGAVCAWLQRPSKHKSQPCQCVMVDCVNAGVLSPAEHAGREPRARAACVRDTARILGGHRSEHARKSGQPSDRITTPYNLFTRCEIRIDCNCRHRTLALPL